MPNLWLVSCHVTSAVQLFADIVELVLFVWPVLYLTRFQFVAVYTIVNDALKERRQQQVSHGWPCPIVLSLKHHYLAGSSS